MLSVGSWTATDRMHQTVSHTWCNVCLKCRRYVYQKAYVEFFVSPEKLDDLEQRLQKQSSITYMAINSKGKVRNPTQPLSWSRLRKSCLE